MVHAGPSSSSSPADRAVPIAKVGPDRRCRDVLIFWAGKVSLRPRLRHGIAAAAFFLSAASWLVAMKNTIPAANALDGSFPPVGSRLERRIGRDVPAESRRDGEAENDDGRGLRYFVYTEEEIAQRGRVKKLSRDLKRIEDVLSEQSIHEALLEHPWWTYNPDDASFFVIPTPVSALSFSGCANAKCAWYDDAFEALSSHEVFRRHQGRRHVLVSLYWFDAHNEAFLRPLRRHLQNVTVADILIGMPCSASSGRVVPTGEIGRRNFRSCLP